MSQGVMNARARPKKEKEKENYINPYIPSAHIYQVEYLDHGALQLDGFLVADHRDRHIHHFSDAPTVYLAKSIVQIPGGLPNGGQTPIRVKNPFHLCHRTVC